MLRRIPSLRNSLVRAANLSYPASKATNAKFASTQDSKAENPTSESKDDDKDSLKTDSKENPEPKKKTQLELDEELRQKLEGIAGDGGDAGRELEDGQPTAMKRGVKNNMFRYI